MAIDDINYREFFLRASRLASYIDATARRMAVKVENQSNESIPVKFTSSANGTLVDYDDVSVISSGSANHDFSFTADTDLINVSVSASSHAHFELYIKVNSGDTLTIKETLIVNPSAQNASFDFSSSPLKIENGGQVRITKYNDDNKNQSLFSTIKGNLL